VLKRGVMVVRQQIVQLDADCEGSPCPYCAERHRGLSFGKPKPAGGEDRVVELDETTLGVLLAHRLTQDAERSTWEAAYREHGLVFAREDGSPLYPEKVTKTFGRLVREAGLPMIRLHDPAPRTRLADARRGRSAGRRVEAARALLDGDHGRHVLASAARRRPAGGGGGDRIGTTRRAV